MYDLRAAGEFGSIKIVLGEIAGSGTFVFRGFPLPITALIALLHSLSTLGQMPASQTRFETNDTPPSYARKNPQFGSTSRN
jgi:hypothetical protein